MVLGKNEKAALPKLTLDRIVAAAILLLESGGLPALSARKLAATLGCEAMSLYHHVKNMDDLLDAIVDHLLASLPPMAESGNLEADLRHAAGTYLALAMRYPNSFVLVATRRWRTERAIATAAMFVIRFRAMGLDAATALGYARAIGAYLNGAGLALAAWRKDQDEDSANTAVAVRADLENGLDRLLSGLIRA